MLIISYILIVTVLLYLCFIEVNNTLKEQYKIKVPITIDCICIAVVIWFGVVLYYAPNHYRGWPVAEYPPAMCYVKDHMVIEPTQDTPGAIYVWTISFTKPDGTKIYNPKDFLEDIKPGVPRVYKLPYSKERQKKVSKKKTKGELLFFKNKKDGFKIIDLQEILKKENE